MKLPLWCLFLALVTGPMRAITVCHDYTWYRVFQQDVNHKGAAQLRKQLGQSGYKMFPLTNAAQTNVEKANSVLKPGDVIILSEDHSAYVDTDGITHYLQLQGEIGKVRTPDQLPEGPIPNNLGGKFKGESLKQLLAHRINPSFPVVEVWRKRP